MHSVLEKPPEIPLSVVQQYRMLLQFIFQHEWILFQKYAFLSFCLFLLTIAGNGFLVLFHIYVLYICFFQGPKGDPGAVVCNLLRCNIIKLYLKKLVVWKGESLPNICQTASFQSNFLIQKGKKVCNSVPHQYSKTQVCLLRKKQYYI